MTPNGHVSELLPEQFPRVIVQGVSYSVKWSQSAIYRLDKLGVDLGEASRVLLTGQIRVSLLFDLLAVCIERTPRFKPEELCDLVPPNDVPSFTAALIEALGKALPSAEVKLRETANQTLAQ